MPLFLRALVSTSLLAAAPLPAQTSPAQPPAVTIRDGQLRGAIETGVLSFKGIPFAQPPVGALRWRAPQPIAKWQGVRDATRYGHDCMQLPFPSDAAPLGTPPAEDCLYMNVWRPVGATTKLPVMVWIYGGGFVNGGSSPPTYSGAALAKQGIMVVSFNYRLGRFGTFAHSALQKADEDKGLHANYGYLDQIAALRWVQANIAAFGGDPTNVTIIGESAGGMSVHALLTSPMTKGLFSRAVIQSGGPMPRGDATLAGAQRASDAFAQSKGIAANDPQALAKLRALDGDTIVDGLNLASFSKPGPALHSAPIADGKIAVEPVAAYKAGAFMKVPVMIGATSNDIGGKDGPMIVGARDMAAGFAAAGLPTYYYRFSYVAETLLTPQTAGAGHASEIPYFFDTVDIKYGSATTGKDKRMGQITSGYLVNFVKNGNPNGSAQTPWQDYAKGNTMLDLNADGAAVAGPDPWAKP